MGSFSYDSNDLHNKNNVVLYWEMWRMIEKPVHVFWNMNIYIITIFMINWQEKSY